MSTSNEKGALDERAHRYSKHAACTAIVTAAKEQNKSSGRTLRKKIVLHELEARVRLLST